MGNPFKELGDFYNDCVKEEDKKGYADKFKQCSKTFFSVINKECKVKAYRIKYLDGYYIFGHGTNSVVHFEIKECPGWLFGIWWNVPEDYVNKDGSIIKRDYIDGQLFAQYEEIIDKFKPSASTFVHSFSITPDSKKPFLYSEVNMINFIKNEPELAFCRDYKGWDYNEEYHTREEAKNVYAKYVKWKETKDKYEKIFLDKLVDFYKENVLKLFKGSKISDRGENWSPRYEVIAPLEKNKDFVECGCYDIFEEGTELKDKYDKLVKECNDISDKCDFYWFNPVDACIMIYSKKQGL